MGTKTLRNKILQIRSLPRKIAWVDINKGDLLHIPRILSIKRKDIIVDDKIGEVVTYHAIGDKQEQKTFSQTSVIGHLVTKKLTF